MNEQDYVTGSRAAYSSVLQHCLIQLGYPPDIAVAGGAKWVFEREKIVAALKRLCDEHSLESREWDDVDLSDVIDNITSDLTHSWNHGERAS